jgi:hypothetical protein
MFAASIVVALLFPLHPFPSTTPPVVESADTITKLLLFATSHSGGAAVPGASLFLHHFTCCRIS